ncbi:hypothetical protein [Leptospira borgpetersenii]|uniref:hypothetical protein n=1 Tax=Leptospira borgpetersenii TaxID=174 RepID=UPI0007745838|nr:hypothetical protein [Leptospira borgpetersenii]MBE8364164.1 hypothetical protein [Leptospira borgpetersenii serovar Balcanica]MBE8367398.1 hypothetical protein [Leptospira borgpetersenii serovar Balcanica]MBE8400776.1 hypothetical protein [Leptospira borgpetersenii serovar Tarassovi]MBE8403726.1 hypothetical protein [Leptospira borgpetersenii serovar Tarassovi]MBE8405569.1 hypothetical protein [Leptospira borgpetersenii serovar Tarassovi]
MFQKLECRIFLKNQQFRIRYNFVRTSLFEREFTEKMRKNFLELFQKYLRMIGIDVLSKDKVF